MCVLITLILPNAEPARRVTRRSGTLLGGGVSEWPKEHASKACEGLRPPRVQIPPPPLFPRQTRPDGPLWTDRAFVRVGYARRRSRPGAALQLVCNSLHTRSSRM